MEISKPLNAPQQILQEVSTALLKEDLPPKNSTPPAGNPLQAKVGKLTTALRRSAMVVLLTAAGSSLFQGWASWDSAQRIMAFAVFIVSLSLTGLLSAFKFNDAKGARVALGLATAVLPVAASQLGGLIYSHFISLSSASSIPSMLRYTAVSVTQTSVLTAALCCLIPGVAYAGFSVLARSEAALLTALFSVGNAALLVPVREPLAIGLLSMALLAGLLAIDLSRFHGRPELRTLEGGLSRAMLFVPFAIMVIRNLALYSVSTVLIGCLFSVLTAFLFIVLPKLTETASVQKIAQTCSTISMAAAWYCFSQALFFERTAMLPLSEQFLYPVRTLPISAGLVLMSFFTVGTAPRYRRSAAYLATMSMFLQLLTFPGLVTSFFCISISILCIAAGCLIEERGFFTAGSWGLALGVLYHLRYAVFFYSGIDPWISLAVLGILTLLSASYLEKNYRTLAARCTAFQEKVRSWD